MCLLCLLFFAVFFDFFFVGCCVCSGGFELCGVMWFPMWFGAWGSWESLGRGPGGVVRGFRIRISSFFCVFGQFIGLVCYCFQFFCG